MATEQEVQALIERLTTEAADRGLLVETGWLALRKVAIPFNAPEVQVECMREAFYAGAQHLMASLLSFLEPGTEPTSKDMRRMAGIASELDEFIRAYRVKHGLGDPLPPTNPH